jgi:hypothetical protein
MAKKSEREKFIANLKRTMNNNTASATERTEARKQFERLVFGGAGSTSTDDVSIEHGTVVVQKPPAEASTDDWNARAKQGEFGSKTREYALEMESMRRNSA